jgi:hypothetical protein
MKDKRNTHPLKPSHPSYIFFFVYIMPSLVSKLKYFIAIINIIIQEGDQNPNPLDPKSQDFCYCYIIGGGAWRLVRLEPHLNLTRVGLASPKL